MLQPTDDSELARGRSGATARRSARLIERHYDMIYRVAYRYVGSAADAEDIAQDVCVTLVTKLGRFSGRSLFSTWLGSIVINRCRDSLRRRKSSAGSGGRYVVQRAARMRIRRTRQRVAGSTRRWNLEPSLRETVLLIVGEEMSHAEAAEALGCAESTVSWRMHVARKQLRAERTMAMNEFDRLKLAMEKERLAPRPPRARRQSRRRSQAFDAKSHAHLAKDRAWSAVSGMRRVPLPKS